MIVAIRPGFGHVEFDGAYYWVIELGFEVQHASSVGVRTYEVALRHLRSMWPRMRTCRIMSQRKTPLRRGFSFKGTPKP